MSDMRHKDVNPPTLHGIIRAHIKQSYFEINGKACPWDGSEADALARMIKAVPSWTEFDWLHSIGNYFHSEGINGARPRRWLPNISDYARGPLDRFGKVQGESNHKQLNAKDIRDALSET